MRAPVLTVAALATLAACGCGGSAEPATYAVTGRVTYGGSPLDDGEIIFSASDRQTAPAAARITSGGYHAWSVPGAKTVSIRASRLVPGSKGANGEPVFDNFIPDRYNVGSKLTAEIKPGGENRFDYTLDR
jgi:hypothetical protein